MASRVARHKPHPIPDNKISGQSHLRSDRLRRDRARAGPVEVDDAGYPGGGPLHLGELIPRLRGRLAIDQELGDAEILASLKSIAAYSEPRARWLAAFNSPLGHWLVVHGCDLNTALSFTLSLLPPPRS